MGKGAEILKEPMFFLKPWSTITFNPSSVYLPSAKIHQVDHELELGFYLSKGGH
jgi:2-keto-4-pentenoate hydratase/2-oxohepta-3-ene-1,7-dioic acid hydratase in catechol pathway